MQRSTRCRRTATLLIYGVCSLSVIFLSSTSHAQSFGVNFQSTADVTGFGPYSVSGFGNGTAFDINGADWYENTSQEVLTPVPFSSPSMSGGSVNIDYHSQPYYNFTAFGWAHANMEIFSPTLGQSALPNANMPHSGEEAVLAGFNFAVGPEEYVIGDPSFPIVVHLTGLNSLGSSYRVRLMASSDPYVDHFVPAMVSDNAGNSGNVNFDTGFLAEEPAWNQAWGDYHSRASVEYAKDVGGQVLFFTGDELTITIEGNNETWPGYPDPAGYPKFTTATPNVFDSTGAGPYDWLSDWTTGGGYIRATLAGLGLYFDDPAVPGDFDSDGDVDGADFVVWQTNFPTASGAMLDDGDADGDGDVDGADFVVWQTNFPFTPAPGVSQVPEPNALLLLAIGVAAALPCGKRWFDRASKERR